MLSGVKFIPRGRIDRAQDEKSSDSTKERKKSGNRKEKNRKKKKISRYSSSDDEEIEKIRKGSKKNKKWYSSEEYTSSSSERESESSSERDGKKSRRRRNEKKAYGDRSRDEASDRSKKRPQTMRELDSSEDYSSSDLEDEGGDGFSGRKDRNRRSGKEERTMSKKRGTKKDVAGEESLDDAGGSHSLTDKEIVRKEMGLEWMLRPSDNSERKPATTSDQVPEEPQADETMKVNPRELNPYLKDDGNGYPEEMDGTKVGGNRLLSSSVVGDGGASWRMKALKRAQEQAAREGRKFDEVVEERWGSLGQLTVSLASHAAAPSRAHLHAIKSRKKGLTQEQQTPIQDYQRDSEKNSGREYLKDVSVRNPEMKAPKVHNSLSWGKRKGQNVSTKDVGLISDAVASLNKFANDGSFMHEVVHRQNIDTGGPLGSSYANCEGDVMSKSVSLETNQPGEASKQALSANQLAAKALRLRMEGKHKEAEELLKQTEIIKAKQGTEENTGERSGGGTSRYVMHDSSVRRKRKEDDADLHLAQKIMQSKQYNMSSRADDEYDFDDAPSRKTRKKEGGNDRKLTEKNNFANRILTQQERCQFCFENPTRPRHLVVAIANFSYLMLPQWQPVVPGHCCILPMQHESSTRTLDNNVWDEIRNFKKCLIMMFAKQEKDLVFLETVMGLAQQRRHCLVECIPLPRETAKQAPLYFKKAIDEAEDEWSQHNAKKLIDTSEKGLRGSIPKDFPYFHVEFGLNKGFVHVIDDEKQFKSSLGLDVIRGMLRLPEEDMHRRRRHESAEAQKQAVVNFARDWEPFDWTKQLE
ncbi:uncharacterized protein LOC100264750 [Vitis vinifera]|eukprot:XP_010650013.1 PREDICTED: CWF19-like protein 2 [Vitis vinifera]